jgi:hypothetical protein
MWEIRAILQGDLEKQLPLFNLDLENMRNQLSQHFIEAYFLPQYQFSHLIMYFQNHFTML